MHQSEIKNPKLLNFLQEHRDSWNKDSYWLCDSLGDLFTAYHDIMMLWGLQGYYQICHKYWHAFFSGSQVPAFIILNSNDGDEFVLDAMTTARQILQQVVTRLTSDLDSTQRAARNEDR